MTGRYEIDDKDARLLDGARRIAFCLSEAERHLGLVDDGSLDARCLRVLGAAMRGNLDPLLYRVVWLLAISSHGATAH